MVVCDQISDTMCKTYKYSSQKWKTKAILAINNMPRKRGNEE